MSALSGGEDLCKGAKIIERLVEKSRRIRDLSKWPNYLINIHICRLCHRSRFQQSINE